MSRRHWAHIVAAAVVAAAFAAAAPAAASTASGAVGTAGKAAAAGPSASATAYLQARAAAITAADPAATLAPWVVPGSGLARTEAKVAAGTALRGAAFGRSVESAACRVTVLDSQPADDGVTAVVAAHVITTLTWRSANGKTDVGGQRRRPHRHAAAQRRRVGGHRRRLQRRPQAGLPRGGRRLTRPRARGGARRGACGRAAAPAAELGASRGRARARRYSAIIMYDRAGAQSYADARALSYNPTFVRFTGADCANFASQCARAGDMPQASGAVTSGWWYDKDGSSSPSDDTYSLSWINVTRQIGYWNARRTDWETSAGKLSRGDFIYYDWTGDGVWDHVAVVAGTNSSGQKMIDAHTTDHYHVYWKLGYTGTKYRYARVRAQWVVV